jgi:hypothetical protein
VNPIVLPPGLTLPPEIPSHPISGGWTVAWLPGIGFVLVPPPGGVGTTPPPSGGTPPPTATPTPTPTPAPTQ